MTDRLRSVAWIVDLLDEVESDLSVFHRIDDMLEMPAVRFVKFAERLPAYTGAVQARLRMLHPSPPPTAPDSGLNIQSEPEGVAQGGAPVAWAGTLENPHEVVMPGKYRDRKDVTVVPMNRQALQASELREFLSFGYG